jgi:hypothetical protein
MLLVTVTHGVALFHLEFRPAVFVKSARLVYIDNYLSGFERDAFPRPPCLAFEI